MNIVEHRGHAWGNIVNSMLRHSDSQNYRRHVMCDDIV